MQKLSQHLKVWLLALPLVLGATIFLPDTAEAQRTRRNTRQLSSTSATFTKGYGSGYSDGYSTGKNDYRARANVDFRSYEKYQRADAGYRDSYGSLHNFQDGYRLGFEMGYIDGLYGRTYSSRLPQNALALRSSTEAKSSQTTLPAATVSVANDTEMVLRLSDTLNTKTSKTGDRFTATVLSPAEYEGATVYGHIAKLERSGRMTGRTEMALAFDSITLRNGRSGRFDAQVEKIHESESVKSVDEEGNVQTSSRSKDTVIRSGGGAALGAIIGAIAGGGKGAAIGAIIGAGAGAGSVYIQGNKDLILEPGTEMTVRTAAAASARQ